MFKRQGQKAANTGSASGRGKSAILRAQGLKNYCWLFIVQVNDTLPSKLQLLVVVEGPEEEVHLEVGYQEVVLKLQVAEEEQHRSMLDNRTIIFVLVLCHFMEVSIHLFFKLWLFIFQLRPLIFSNLKSMIKMSEIFGKFQRSFLLCKFHL